jgi:hypothetical protein
MDAPSSSPPRTSGDFAGLPVFAVVSGAYKAYFPDKDPREFSLFSSEHYAPKHAFVVHASPTDGSQPGRETAIVLLPADRIRTTLGLDPAEIKTGQLNKVSIAGDTAYILVHYGDGVDTRSDDFQEMICHATGLDPNSSAFIHLRKILETGHPDLPRLPLGSPDSFRILQGKKPEFPASLAAEGQLVDVNLHYPKMISTQQQVQERDHPRIH